MTAASRTLMARALVVIATTAGVMSAPVAFAQASPPATPTPGATPQGGPPAGGPGMMQHGHGDRKVHALRMMDSDGDGVISRAEWDAAGKRMAERHAQMFDQADANKDGKLTREEMRALHKAHRGEHGHMHNMRPLQPAQPAQPAAPKP